MSQPWLDVEALHAALDQRLRVYGISSRELARELEISPNVFSRLKAGGQPSVDALVRILCWLDEPLDDFVVWEE